LKHIILALYRCILNTPSFLSRQFGGKVLNRNSTRGGKQSQKKADASKQDPLEKKGYNREASKETLRMGASKRAETETATDRRGKPGSLSASRRASLDGSGPSGNKMNNLASEHLEEGARLKRLAAEKREKKKKPIEPIPKMSPKPSPKLSDGRNELSLGDLKSSSSSAVSRAKTPSRTQTPPRRQTPSGSIDSNAAKESRLAARLGYKINKSPERFSITRLPREGVYRGDVSSYREETIRALMIHFREELEVQDKNGTTYYMAGVCDRVIKDIEVWTGEKAGGGRTPKSTQGWLWKKAGGKKDASITSPGRRNWNRRFFSLKEGVLSYFEGANKPVAMTQPLFTGSVWNAKLPEKVVWDPNRNRFVIMVVFQERNLMIGTDDSDGATADSLSVMETWLEEMIFHQEYYALHGAPGSVPQFTPGELREKRLHESWCRLIGSSLISIRLQEATEERLRTQRFHLDALEDAELLYLASIKIGIKGSEAPEELMEIEDAIREDSAEEEEEEEEEEGVVPAVPTGFLAGYGRTGYGGFLMKKGNGSSFLGRTKWSRRYFTLEGTNLLYYKGDVAKFKGDLSTALRDEEGKVKVICKKNAFHTNATQPRAELWVYLKNRVLHMAAPPEITSKGEEKTDVLLAWWRDAIKNAGATVTPMEKEKEEEEAEGGEPVTLEDVDKLSRDAREQRLKLQRVEEQCRSREEILRRLEEQEEEVRRKKEEQQVVWQETQEEEERLRKLLEETERKLKALAARRQREEEERERRELKALREKEEEEARALEEAMRALKEAQRREADAREEEVRALRIQEEEELAVKMKEEEVRLLMAQEEETLRTLRAKEATAIYVKTPPKKTPPRETLTGSRESLDADSSMYKEIHRYMEHKRVDYLGRTLNIHGEVIEEHPANEADTVLEETCSNCSNVFMPDSNFCRICGNKREHLLSPLKAASATNIRSAAPGHNHYKSD